MIRIKPKKSLSQNFLNDKNISQKIVDFLDCRPGDIILEIGPGTGSLTRLLLMKDIDLTAIETDSRAVSLLNKEFAGKTTTKFKLLEGDILRFSPVDFFGFPCGETGKIKVIGNIPYQLTSAILFWLFKNCPSIDYAVLTVQKEIAQRLAAKPCTKQYGILTVAMNFYGSIIYGFDVSPGCFYPKPKVTSSVIKLIFGKGIFEQEKISGDEIPGIMSLVRTAFGQRRKILRNSLKALAESSTGDSIDEFGIFAGNKGADFFHLRPEELGAGDFIKLYFLLKNYPGK